MTTTTMSQQHPLNTKKQHSDESLYDEASSVDLEHDNDHDHAAVVPTTKLAADQERQTLARRETRAVMALRIVVLLVLLCTGAAMSYWTFSYARNLEEDDFESSFASASQAVLESFHDAMQNNFGSIDALSSAVTEHALSTGQTFPNVTFPGFHILAASTRVMTNAIYVFYIPLVTEEMRWPYEAYCQEQQGYIFPSFFQQQTLAAVQDAYFGLESPPLPGQGRRQLSHRNLHFNLQDDHPTIHAEIFGSAGGEAPRPPGSGPYYPVWQSSPVMPSYMPYNLDLATIAPWDSELKRAAITAKAVLGAITIEAPQLEGAQAPQRNGEPEPEQEVTTTNEILGFLKALGQFRHGDSDVDETTIKKGRSRAPIPGGIEGDPSCQMAYPIFDKFGPDRQVAGLLVIEVFWHFLIEDVLPWDVVGVVVVFENGFGQVVTYRIDGANSGFLGQGDLHDPAYDGWGVTQNVAEYLRSRATPETQSVTFVELDDSFNNYRISIYPSSDMRDTHVSNDPILYSVVIGCVFVFCAIVFLAYDCMVERRQRLVLNRAVQSTAVVSSLFPEKVRERLMEEHAEKPKEKKAKANAWNASTADKSLAEFLNHSGEFGNVPSRAVGKPIADHIEESTIFFGDLVGFTQWSSTRKAEDVFELLETIFGVFDKVALRLKVFKVETIGDCYVAATGVPDPQVDHAVIMVRFARECLARMRMLLQDIKGRLGEDTAELNMRIGIHSGPITAGVLRGEKGRFQLFGDTINTASRMESNGRPGSIQVSDTTAALLRAAGKSHWLVEREDRIVAKGKGEMKTYLIATAAVASSPRMTGSVTSESTSKGLHSQLYPSKLRNVDESNDNDDA
eukprot:scaffold599_cov180-Amphora_coffeaeformis.AAC.3